MEGTTKGKNNVFLTKCRKEMITELLYLTAHIFLFCFHKKNICLSPLFKIKSFLHYVRHKYCENTLSLYLNKVCIYQQTLLKVLKLKCSPFAVKLFLSVFNFRNRFILHFAVIIFMTLHTTRQDHRIFVVSLSC